MFASKRPLNSRLKRAAKLMFFMPDESIAKELNVRVSTIEKWRQRPEVRTEIKRLHREYKSAAARFAAKFTHDAAAKLFRLLEKDDAKVLLDSLKLAGVFDLEEVGEPAKTLEEIVEEAARRSASAESC